MPLQPYSKSTLHHSEMPAARIRHLRPDRQALLPQPKRSRCGAVTRSAQQRTHSVTAAGPLPFAIQAFARCSGEWPAVAPEFGPGQGSGGKVHVRQQVRALVLHQQHQRPHVVRRHSTTGRAIGVRVLCWRSEQKLQYSLARQPVPVYCVFSHFDKPQHNVKAYAGFDPAPTGEYNSHRRLGVTEGIGPKVSGTPVG